MGVVRRDVSDLMADGERELGLVVHKTHQLARDVDVTARDRKGVRHGGVQRREVKRLAGVGDAGISAHPAADRFNIGRAPAGLGAAEFADKLGVLALRFGDILRIEVAQLLRGGRRERQCGASKQKEGSTHQASPLSRFAPTKRGDFERRMTVAGS